MRRIFRKRFIDVEDPLMNAVLLLLLISAGIGMLLADGNGAARDAILKTGAGVLLVFGSYFGARTLKQTRADQRATRMLKAAEMLANSSRPVRLAAMWTLVDLGNSTDGKREEGLLTAIRSVLRSERSKWADDAALQEAVLGLLEP